ncbi:ABC transporter transmembrane domain-containing protein [Rapidithrix thailandica]|uniref:ABC transporter transmembrane domain-containing protein n=1 Tax=Rapidithrix thailandica TaxID=413964 RepID=A0AAW9S624_9BACT
MALFRRNTSSEKNEKIKLNKKNLKGLLGIYHYMLPYRNSFIAGFICLLFSSTILMAFPYLTGKLVDVSTGKSTWLFTEINQIALALLGVLVVQSIFSFFRIFFFARVSEHAMAAIRKALYTKFMFLPLAFFDQRRTGELTSRITADISTLQNAFSVTLAELVRQSSVLLIGIGMLLVTNARLTLFMVATFPVLVLAGLLFGKFIQRLSKATQDALAKSNIVVEETLQAVSMVKAFTNEKHEINRYSQALGQSIRLALKAARYRGAFVSFLILGLLGGIVLVLWFGGKMVHEGSISIGDLTSFIIYTMFIGGSIGGLGDVYGNLQKAVGASERVLEILNLEDEFSHSKPFENKLRLDGQIEFSSVSFSYPTRKEIHVLKDIHLSIRPGEKIALVGHSGAGKSTVIQVLLQFYSLDQGQILIDGKAVQDYPLETYRANIGIVPQEVILFGGSIRENIAYGKPHATEEEIYEAARKANALDFIDSFPDKMETLVGERGVKLSGGQRQRIAIARAILKDPAILILDEATSSLDAQSEALVQEALDELMQGRTSIIIAHRLATIRKADRIYVLEEGSIVEEGSHEELLQDKSGIYSHLIQLQFDLKEEALSEQ